MFNILEISSTTLSALRCKQCMNIIFRQDNISAFISYDSEDLGLLKQFNQHPKLQTEADYFVLSQELSYYSSMQANYEQSLIKNYHPFFKMYMFQLSCEKCKFPLGYIVETVNQNTIWLQDKVLIDVKNCAVIKDGRDEMNKLIKALRLRLARKLVLEQERNSKNQKKFQDRGNRNKAEQKKMKQRKVLIKLQKIYDTMREKSEKNKLKNNKQPIKKKRPNIINNKIQQPSTDDNNNNINNKLSSFNNNNKIQQSLLTTNISSSANMILSKQDTNPIYHSLMISNGMKGGEDDEEEERKDKDNRQVKMGESLDSNGNSVDISQNKILNSIIIKPQPPITDDIDQNDLPSLHITPQQRQLLFMNIHLLKQQITNHSNTLQSHSIIQKILYLLTKMSQQQRYVFNKIPYQINKLKTLVTYIRQRFIERRNRRR